MAARLALWTDSPATGALLMPSAFPAGCVGYREDIFASKQGAECVAQFLGRGYYVSEAARSCITDGFPYTVVPLR